MKMVRSFKKFFWNVSFKMFSSIPHNKIVSNIPDLKEFMNQNKDPVSNNLDINNIPNSCNNYIIYSNECRDRC